MRTIFPMSLKTSFIFAVMLILSSCMTTKIEDKDISLKDTSEHIVKVSDLISKYEWIHLDSIPNASIGNAARIIEHNGRIYILDLTSRKEVLTFGADGKFLNTIGVQGNGHGEYPDILDFAVNTTNGDIAILSPASTVYVYNEVGNFIRSVKLTESLLWHIIFTQGHYICSTDHCTYTEGDDAFLIYTFTSDFKPEGKYIPVLPQQMPSTAMFEGLLSSQGDTGYYMDMFTHSLYEINNSGIPDLLFTFSLPDAMPNSVFGESMEFYMQQTKHDWIKTFIPLQDSFLLTYVVNGNLCMAEISNEGKIKVSGLIGGILPKMFPAAHGSILSPVTREEYQTEWLGIPEEELTIKDMEGNLLLLRWHLNETTPF